MANRARVGTRPDGVAAHRRRLLAVVAEAAVAENLLASPSDHKTCSELVDEIARQSGCEWCTVLQPTGATAALEVAASHGTVPVALREPGEMTPLELAAALGWRAGETIAQVCNADPPRAVPRPGSIGAGVADRDLAVGHLVVVPLLLKTTSSSTSGEAAAIAVVGWGDLGVPGATELATIDGLCRLAAAVFGYETVVDDLRIADRTKSEFVATMSHELRTPLSAIVGYTDLLVRGEFGSLADEQGEVLRRAQRSANTLLDLINATLDVSRFEVGDRRDADADVDVLEIVRGQVEETVASHAGRPVRFVEPGTATALIMYTDALKVRVAIRQVLAAAVAANPGTDLGVAAKAVSEGFEIAVAPLDAPRRAPGVSVRIELPEDGDAPDAPFSIFVAKRLLEILGGTLSGSRYADAGVGFKMWLPRVAPTSAATFGPSNR